MQAQFGIARQVYRYCCRIELFFREHLNCFYLQLEFAQYRYTHVLLG